MVAGGGPDLIEWSGAAIQKKCQAACSINKQDQLTNTQRSI